MTLFPSLRPVPVRRSLMTANESIAAQIAEQFGDQDFMRWRVPALFATQPHPDMSERYSFTNTYEIVKSMVERGYTVSSIQGGYSKYAKMLLRMRPNHEFPASDGMPELIIIDSHDGSCSLKLMLGYIKFLCMNGMIVGDTLYHALFRHRRDDLMAQVQLELQDIGDHIKQMMQQIADMKSYQTTGAERMKLADNIIKLRFGEDKDASFVADMRRNMLSVQRREDDKLDLFTQMNVIQENVIRGGFQYTNTNGGRTMTMKDIRSVDRNVELNTALWQSAVDIMLPKLAA